MAGPSVTLPATPAYAATARLFVAAAARHFGVDEADVDDARLAVSEVFAASVASLASQPAGGSPGSVHVALAPGLDGAVLLQMAVPAALPSSDDRPDLPDEVFRNDAAADTSLRLVRILFPDTAIEARADGATVVAFTVPGAGEDGEGAPEA